MYDKQLQTIIKVQCSKRERIELIKGSERFSTRCWINVRSKSRF